MPDIKDLKEEYNTLSDQLTDPELISDWERFQEISKRRAALEKIIRKHDELEEIRDQIAENEQIMESDEDPELVSIATQELSQLKEQEKKLNRDMTLASGEQLPDAIIMEIRPGTGGDEASLFATDLWNMYAKYAAQKGWGVTILNTNETEVGGLREIAFEVGGEDAFASLQYEGGVHRVQRIPETEKAGRIHTSTVSVAVLPKPKKTDLTINPSDLKVEFTNSSGPGGQNVNKRKTAARVIHVPSGMIVVSQASRNQQTNRDFAIALIQARLIEQKRQQDEKELSGARKAQIGSSERAEKIRTYNFPQDRVTDHRIPKSWHGIESILEGNIDDIVESLQEFAAEEKAKQNS